MVWILMILMAWFVEMPLWLSIVTTVFSGLGIIAKIVQLASED